MMLRALALSLLLTLPAVPAWADTKRYAEVPLVGKGTGDDPFRPDLPSGLSFVMLGERDGRALVLALVPDDSKIEGIADRADLEPTSEPTRGADTPLATTLSSVEAAASQDRAEARDLFVAALKEYGLDLNQALNGYDVR